MLSYQNTLAFAQEQDRQDPLASFRDEFVFPQHEGQDSLYFCGNSLGIMPKRARESVMEEINRWAERGVLGHFYKDNPWYDSHKPLMPLLANVVGAKPKEVVPMNLLTVNLHLLLVSFYRPNGGRYKIITEAGAFPSDQYVLESQVALHGYSYDQAVIEVYPREGEHTLHTEDIIKAIEEAGDSLALVMMSGVNYYTGQAFEIKPITAAAHKAGALAGFDLAHAAGNIELNLHNWQVDFATWCSYKYLNSSPGGISGIYIHEKHADNPATPRLAGWWGYNEDTRFEMTKGFDPMPGAEGWQLSNAPVILLAAHKASLELFEEAGMSRLREKSCKLTGFLEYILQNTETGRRSIEIITPAQPRQRGAQLSLLVRPEGKAVFDHLEQNGVICDWRKPDVIRLAPAPIYNSFQDVYQLGQVFKQAFQN